MIETIIKMEKAGIAIAAAAVLLILVMTIYENLSEEFYKKGLNQVIGGIVAVEVVREFCKDLQVHKVVISFIVVSIVVIPAMVFQIRDYEKMKERKKRALLRACIKVMDSDNAVNRVKAMREERKIRKRSVMSFMYDYGAED